MVGAQTQPGTERFLVGPGTDIGTDLEEDCLRSLQTDSVDAGQIHAADSVQLHSQIELLFTAQARPLVAGFWPCGGQGFLQHIDFGGHLLEFAADLLPVGRYLTLEVVVALQGHLEIKEQLLLPVALQAFSQWSPCWPVYADRAVWPIASDHVRHPQWRARSIARLNR